MLVSTISRRELAKEDRRQRILDAAEALIEQSGSTDFSMAQLAETAGTSPFTTYNLIGPKAAVLYVLLNRSLDQIDAMTMMRPTPEGPLEFVFAAAENIVRVFTARPELYRPLFRFLLGSPDVVHRPGFMRRSIDYWRFAFAPLDAAGWLDGVIHKIDLVREAQMFFTGVLEYWVHDDLTHEEFSQHVSHGFAIRLLALGIPGSADPLAARIAASRPGIMRLIGQPRTDQ